MQHTVHKAPCSTLCTQHHAAHCAHCTQITLVGLLGNLDGAGAAATPTTVAGTGTNEVLTNEGLTNEPADRKSGASAARLAQHAL